MPIAGEGVVVVVVRPIAGEQWAYMGESGSSRESTQVQVVQKHKQCTSMQKYNQHRGHKKKHMYKYKQERAQCRMYSQCYNTWDEVYGGGGEGRQQNAPATQHKSGTAKLHCQKSVCINCHIFHQYSLGVVLSRISVFYPNI